MVVLGSWFGCGIWEFLEFFVFGCGGSVVGLALEVIRPFMLLGRGVWMWESQRPV